MGDFGQFDILVGVLLLISAGVGFMRGAVREIAALVALVGGIAFSVIGLPMTSAIARKVIHTPWLAAALALAGMFVVTYIALRLVGAYLAQRVGRTAMLGTLDRSAGFAIGLARGLVVLGVLNLMFNAATPQDLKPRWITQAQTWPLAQNMGRAIASLAPKGMDAAGRLKPAFDRSIRDTSRDRSTTEGYDARERSEIDNLVEQSR